MMATIPNAAEQALPPSVNEILTAYAAKGTDGDKQVLLAILQAKAAEDQRITALAALNQQYAILQRHAIEAAARAMHQQHPRQSQPQSQSQARPSSIEYFPATEQLPISPYSAPRSRSPSRSRSPPPPHHHHHSSSSKRYDAETVGPIRSSRRSPSPRRHSHHHPYTFPAQPHRLHTTQPLQPTSLPLSPSLSSSSTHNSQHRRNLSNSSAGTLANSPSGRRLDINSMLSTSPTTAMRVEVDKGKDGVPTSRRGSVPGTPVSAIRGGAEDDKSDAEEVQ